MMMRLTYLTRNYKNTGNGGGKARIDSEDILDGMGAVNLGRKRTFHTNKVADFILNIDGIIRLMCRLRRGDILILQYPIKKFYTMLCRIAHMRGAKVITLVHDLGSFRRRRISVDTELRRLGMSDVVIAANGNTEAWLREQGFKRPVVQQIAWDFLTPASPSDKIADPLSVSFIGALSPQRNGFLYHLPGSVKLHLYGKNGDSSSLSGGSVVHGFATPDHLVAHAEGRYGLIWYGESTSQHIGYIGEYIRYCNPHKLALYMRAGKPVIVWRGSGVARWVENEEIGITVDHLDDLDRVLAGISDEEYARMRRNALAMGKRMARGEFLTRTINECIKILESGSDI